MRTITLIKFLKIFLKIMDFHQHEVNKHATEIKMHYKCGEHGNPKTSCANRCLSMTPVSLKELQLYICFF